MATKVDEIHDYMITLVLRAGKIISNDYKESIKFDYKADGSVVTKTDLAVQEYVVKRLKKRFPNVDILSEEMQSNFSGTGFVLDPLDGTGNFSTRIPFFNIALAYMSKDEVLVGVVYNPITNDLFTAIKGKGSYHNGKKIIHNHPERKILSICYHGDKGKATFSKFFGEEYSKVKDIRKYGAGALEICYTAKGIFEGFIGFDVKLWDFAAASVIAKEANMEVTTYKTKDGYNIVVSHGKLHTDVCNLVESIIEEDELFY